MSSFGPNSVQLPVGTDADRPSSPSVGFLRYNTDQYGVEMYTAGGWKVAGGPPGSSNNPAASGTALYNSGITTTGNYFLNGGSGTSEYYVKMDYGGGWINVNTGNSTYTSLLTAGWGSGGSSLFGGSNATGTALLNGGNSGQSQAGVYGCPGQNGKSYLNLNSSFVSDFGITEARIKIYYVSDDGNVTCGPYWTSAFSSRTVITGSSTQIDGACNNAPNRYSDAVGTGFTVEYYGPLISATRILEAWTACGGSYTMRVLEVYVR